MSRSTVSAAGGLAGRPARGAQRLLGFAARAGLARLMRSLEAGELRIELPSGEPVVCRGPAPGLAADIRFLKWRTGLRLLAGGAVGLAASYRDGEWDSSDLPTLIEWAARNGDGFAQSIGGLSPLRLTNRLAHRLNANTRAGSRRNVVAHYDLGNDFYRLWLDESMTYSSAIFADPRLTLEEAQAAKSARVIELLRLEGAESVLEIGSGWGALALAIARASRARVTGLTLSPAQIREAQARARQEGLAERVDFRLTDYRDVRGRFDRIVSVEMIEAVGRARLPTYFETIRTRLKPGGICVLQAITIAEDRFESYCRAPDFIQTFIFPGGFLPSRRHMLEVLEAQGLRLVGFETFGASYARTLAEWRRRFLAAWPQIETMGIPPSFRRLWDFYLSYCEGGFRAGAIDVGFYALAPESGRQLGMRGEREMTGIVAGSCPC